MYGLAGNWCEECGRAKSFRLFPGTLTGCGLCDEVVTRHRCTGRPPIEDLADGQTWECPECGSTWTPRTEERDCPDCCGDCGHQVAARTWDSEKGGRIDTAPRHVPQPFTPFRNRFAGPCYRTDGGIMTHVKPGCRCK